MKTIATRCPAKLDLFGVLLKACPACWRIDQLVDAWLYRVAKRSFSIHRRPTSRLELVDFTRRPSITNSYIGDCFQVSIRRRARRTQATGPGSIFIEAAVFVRRGGRYQTVRSLATSFA